MLSVTTKTALIVHDNIVVYSDMKFPVLTEIYELLHYKKLIESIKKCSYNLMFKCEENLLDKRIKGMEEFLLYKKREMLLFEEIKRLEQEAAWLKTANINDGGYQQLQNQVTNLNETNKALVERKERLEICVKILRKNQIKAKEKIEELAIIIRQLKFELQGCLRNLELEKEKTSRLEDEVCDLLEAKQMQEENKEFAAMTESIEKEKAEMEKKESIPMSGKKRRKKSK